MKTLKGLILSVIVSLFFVTPIFSLQNESDQPDTIKVNQWLDQAYILAQQGNIPKARQLVAKADSLSQAIDYMDGMAFSTVRKGVMLGMEQQNDSAIAVFKRGIEVYQKSETAALPDLFNGLGNIYKQQGECEQAIVFFEKALGEQARISEQVKDQFEAGLKMNIGACYVNMGLMKRAIENYLMALEYAQENSDTYLEALATLNVGQSYAAQDDYERAEYYYRQSVELSQQMDLKQLLAFGYNNLAVALIESDQLGEAEAMLQRSEDTYREITPDNPSLPVLVNYGWLYREMEQYDRSESYLMEALRHAQALNYPMAEYHTYHELGKLFKQQGIYETSAQYLENALQVALQINATNELEEIYQTLYENSKEARRFDDALTYHEQYNTISDSLALVREEMRLAGLESQLELNRQNEINRLLSEKQEQQAARLQFQGFLIAAGGLILLLIGALLFLSWKNAREKEKFLQEIQVHRDELKELNKAKDKVFAVVSHDLRSPLTSVQGLIELIRSEALSGQELQHFLNGVESSIQENVNVIEELLAWAKNQLSGFDLHPEPLELQPLLYDVITTQSFSAIQKEIDLRNNVPTDTSSVLADPNAMRLIFRNLISNAIKYTETGGEILVTLSEGEEKMIVLVKDNGIGIPESARGKVFNSKTWTRSGTQKEKGSGFGLSMTKEFVEKMNGRIWFESEEGKGTTFFVELPKGR